MGAIVAFFVIKKKYWSLPRGGDPEQKEPLSPIVSGFKDSLKRKFHANCQLWNDLQTVVQHCIYFFYAYHFSFA